MSALVLVMSCPGAAGVVIFEMPKSSTLIESWPSARWMQKRFAGLRSRWTIPSACASAMRLARLEDEVDRLLDGHRAPRLEPRREVAPLEVLHDHVRRAVLELPHVGHARDVLALDLDRRARLAEEARDGLALRSACGQEELERDPLVELEVVRRDDDPHPARRRARARRGTCPRARRRASARRSFARRPS